MQDKGEYLGQSLAQMCVCRSPVGLKAENVGFCVGVMLWDTDAEIGGLVEIMQPHSKGTVSVRDVGIYADTGVAELIRRMELLGADRRRIQAKIAGGATLREMMHISDMSQIGMKNIAAVRSALQENDIRIAGEDVGMDVSRTIYFQPSDGRCTICVPGMPEKVI